MNKLKFFILDSNLGHVIDTYLKWGAKDCQIPIETTLVPKYSRDYLRELPLGYDAYVIHFSDIYDESVLDKLREEQPWCRIFGTSRGMPYLRQKSCDEVLCMFQLEDWINIINRTAEIYRDR